MHHTRLQHYDCEQDCQFSLTIVNNVLVPAVRVRQRCRRDTYFVLVWLVFDASFAMLGQFSSIN